MPKEAAEHHKHAVEHHTHAARITTKLPSIMSQGNTRRQRTTLIWHTAIMSMPPSIRVTLPKSTSKRTAIGRRSAGALRPAYQGEQLAFEL